MHHHRHGTSLCEVLLALLLLATTAGWALAATAAAERALGAARARRAALHRAERALADLGALPCDSVVAPGTTSERRWHIRTQRQHTSSVARDEVTLHSAVGDTIRLRQSSWCR